MGCLNFNCDFNSTCGCVFTFGTAWNVKRLECGLLDIKLDC